MKGLDYIDVEYEKVGESCSRTLEDAIFVSRIFGSLAGFVSLYCGPESFNENLGADYLFSVSGLVEAVTVEMLAFYYGISKVANFFGLKNL
jgi:hypothetical protein